jgi:ABC-2 type transport system permease protein
MNKTWTITQRELGSYITSPLFWILAAAFLAFTGFIFALYVTQPQGAQATMGPLLSLIGTILLFVAPLLSMRLLAEEQRSGTLELLMTSPLRDWQVVWGKWLAALIVLAIMVALTAFHVGIMVQLATKGIAYGPLLASYLGVLLLCAAMLAIGTLTSSLTENQVVAAFLGIMLVMILWFVPLMAEATGSEGAVAKIFTYLGLSEHFGNFGRGVIDSRDVVYFLTLTVGSLYLATRVLETRRWR